MLPPRLERRSVPIGHASHQTSQFAGYDPCQKVWGSLDYCIVATYLRSTEPRPTEVVSVVMVVEFLTRT